jgi:adenylate cyclase
MFVDTLAEKAMPNTLSRQATLKLVQSHGECDNPQSNSEHDAMRDKQRRMIAMFADVSDSARLFERLGDTEASYAVERCLKRMERAIAGYGGRTIKVSGDGLLAVFESAERSCQAAIDMQARVSKLPPVSGLKLTIRIGLHIGTTLLDDSLADSTVETAGLIASKARIDQILASSLLIDELPRQTLILTRAMPDLGSTDEGETSFGLAEVDWANHDDQQRRYGVTFDATPSQFLAEVSRLCIRYRGNAFLLDEKTPFLTLGRDPSSKLLIVDRKASRAHGRIERRNNRYFYVDSSTNGTYITSGDQGELLIRRKEIELVGSGLIAFGTSTNDPKADFAEFEHL